MKIRRHFMRARQRTGFGWSRWSTRWIYDALGLFGDYRVVRKSLSGKSSWPTRPHNPWRVAHRKAQCRKSSRWVWWDGGWKPAYDSASEALPEETGGMDRRSQRSLAPVPDPTSQRGPGATPEVPAVIAVWINWQLARERPGWLGWRRGSQYRWSWVTPVEGRGSVEGGRKKRRRNGRLAMRLRTPELFSEVADRVTCHGYGEGVSLLREPDSANPHVRFDERDVEPETWRS